MHTDLSCSLNLWKRTSSSMWLFTPEQNVLLSYDSHWLRQEIYLTIYSTSFYFGVGLDHWVFCNCSVIEKMEKILILILPPLFFTVSPQYQLYNVNSISMRGCNQLVMFESVIESWWDEHFGVLLWRERTYNSTKRGIPYPILKISTRLVTDDI